MFTLRTLQPVVSFDFRSCLLLLPMLLMLALFGCGAQAQSELLPGGKSILPEGALLTTPVGGLERTKTTTQIAPVTGQAFTRALRVVVARVWPKPMQHN
jgi:hypothetical protein